MAKTYYVIDWYAINIINEQGTGNVIRKDDIPTASFINHFYVDAKKTSKPFNNYEEAYTAYSKNPQNLAIFSLGTHKDAEIKYSNESTEKNFYHASLCNRPQDLLSPRMRKGKAPTKPENTDSSVLNGDHDVPHKEEKKLYYYLTLITDENNITYTDPKSKEQISKIKLVKKLTLPFKKTHIGEEEIKKGIALADKQDLFMHQQGIWVAFTSSIPDVSRLSTIEPKDLTYKKLKVLNEEKIKKGIDSPKSEDSGYKKRSDFPREPQPRPKKQSETTVKEWSLSYLLKFCLCCYSDGASNDVEEKKSFINQENSAINYKT